jgi:hypothetical protein
LTPNKHEFEHYVKLSAQTDNENELRFRALLTDGSRELRFEWTKMG